MRPHAVARGLISHMLQSGVASQGHTTHSTSAVKVDHRTTNPKPLTMKLFIDNFATLV